MVIKFKGMISLGSLLHAVEMIDKYLFEKKLLQLFISVSNTLKWKTQSSFQKGLNYRPGKASLTHVSRKQ
jgi:hypothetical protein